MTPLIGAELAYRKKQMFTVPVGEWFKSSSYDWLHRTLLGSQFLGHLFRPEAMQEMLSAHRDGSANRTRELRALAALSLWATQAGL